MAYKANVDSILADYFIIILRLNRKMNLAVNLCKYGVLCMNTELLEGVVAKHVNSHFFVTKNRIVSSSVGLFS